MRTLLLIVLLAGFAAAARAQSSAEALHASAWQAAFRPGMVERADEAAPRSVVIAPAPPNPGVPDGVARAGRPQTTALNWIDYSLLAATGVAAAVAIHYKSEADERHEQYLQTGDRSLRPEIRALDRRSGLALVAMQAGLSGFAVRLLLR